jgi:phage tail-like protein
MPQPQLQSTRSIARRKVELGFDIAIRLRSDSLLVPALEDRYTPINWIAAGGNASDAMNPANYTITRPSGGNLSGPAEAIDLDVVQCEEPETGVTIVGGFRVATKVILVLDFDQTSRADYRVQAANILDSTGAFVIDPAHDTADWIGHVISWANRNFKLYDLAPSVVRRLDQQGTGDFEKFCKAIQETFDRFAEDIDAYFNELCTLDYMRPEWLNALLYDLGDQFSEIFDLTTLEKRRLAGSLVTLYRLKGTCPGIIQVIEYFLGITMLGCKNGWDGTWELADGAYPAPIGGNFLSEGVYPAQSGGDAFLGPVGAEIWSFWLLYPGGAGALTADQLAKIAALVEIWKEAYSHYLGVKAP